MPLRSPRPRRDLNRGGPQNHVEASGRISPQLGETHVRKSLERGKKDLGVVLAEAVAEAVELHLELGRKLPEPLTSGLDELQPLLGELVFARRTRVERSS
jgi:hypothetical protein